MGHSRLKFGDFLNLVSLKPQRGTEHGTEAIIQKKKKIKKISLFPAPFLKGVMLPERE